MITISSPPNEKPVSPGWPEFNPRATRLLALLALLVSLWGLSQASRAQEPQTKITAIEQALEKKDWQQAGDAIEQGLAEHPNDVRLLMLKGVWLASKGELGQAKRLFEEMTVRFPELSEPYNNLGVVMAELGDLAGARVQFNKAVLADPSNTSAQNNLRKATPPADR